MQLSNAHFIEFSCTLFKFLKMLWGWGWGALWCGKILLKKCAIKAQPESSIQYCQNGHKSTVKMPYESPA
jgi:hypothetical protein